MNKNKIITYNFIKSILQLKGDYMLDREELYNKFVQDFARELKKQVHKKKYDKVIFFCVGTDRVAGDSFRTNCWV